MVNMHRRKWGREEIFRDGTPNPIHPSLPSLPPASHPAPRMPGLKEPLAERRVFLQLHSGVESGGRADVKKWVLGIPSGSSPASYPWFSRAFLSAG